MSEEIVKQLETDAQNAVKAAEAAALAKVNHTSNWFKARGAYLIVAGVALVIGFILAKIV